MRIKVILCVIGICFNSYSYAGITVVTSTFVDGATVTLQGIGFGQHGLNIGFIGSKTGHLHSTSVGAMLPNYKSGFSFLGGSTRANLYVYQGRRGKGDYGPY